MRITIITLFPEVFTYMDFSILQRAREKGLLKIEYVNPRDFCTDRHRTVDDYPYGGGSGMVIKPEPVFKAVEYAKNELKNTGKVIITSPQGQVLSQLLVESLSREESLVFLCGHYEGFDERIFSLADFEISIGDYVLTGGELPAMVIIDAIIRQIPGVIDTSSALFDSFKDYLLDYPNYTRPPVFRGMEVPPVLLSGNHEMIRLWRRKERLKRTLSRRPDLLEKSSLSPEDQQLIEEILREK